MQLRAASYHPVRYWVTVLMVALFGTMIADGSHVALGAPYYVDSCVYLLALVGLLAWWRTSEGALSVHSITTARRERFSWGTVLLTFGLGTALGDTTASRPRTAASTGVMAWSPASGCCCSRVSSRT